MDVKVLQDPGLSQGICDPTVEQLMPKYESSIKKDTDSRSFLRLRDIP